MNLDRVTDSHVELNVLDDRQEFLINGLHKISFDYDEDSSFQQITSIAFGYYCCEIEMDAPQFKYYYSKSKVTQKMVLCKFKDFF
jgi:hypothetical protein